MRINEVDPRNYDSDIDYYNALNAKPKARVPSEPRLSPAQQDAEDEDAISQKRQAAHAQFQKGRKVEYVDDEGTAPNGQKYNKLYVIHAKDEATAQHEEYLFDKHEWGAKKIIDVKREKNEDGTVTHTMYIVDNHKYGLWRPWKDSPVYKEGTEPAVEARKANTASARREFSKRDKKPTLSPAEQDKEKQNSDRLWAQLMAHAEKNNGELKEFAPADGGDDSEDALRNYAKMWYNGDLGTQQKIEKILAQAGWEIGELESEEGGAFVVQSGDEHGDSYIGFTAEDLTEAELDEKAPPGMEQWIKDRKPDFKKRYGDKWQQVLYATAWKHKKNESVEEGMLNNPGQEESPVAQAITRRILMQRTDLLGKYGPAKVGQAIDDVAEWVGDVDEIGSSDVSGWVRQVEQSLNSMGESVTEADNPKDVICVDVPLFIRLLEYAREDASTDMDLHDVAERLIKLSASGETVTMSSYDSIVGAQTEIKEAGMEQVEQGRKNIISILKAAEQGQDAQIIVGGEPITLEYPEARYVSGRYKAFMKADRQGEFLRAITDPVAFDRIMAKMRAVLNKQKNFRGSVPGERGVEEGVVDTIKSGAKKAFKALTGPDDEELIQRLEKETGGKRPEKKDMPPVKENEYYCRLDKVVKLIPEGYKRTADGYITRK